MRVLRLSILGGFMVTALAQTNNPSEPFFKAIRRAAAADVERLLKNGADPRVVDAEGTPALMAAALFGNAQMVEVLLRHGADPNQTGPAGTTALMWAIPDLQKAR